MSLGRILNFFTISEEAGKDAGRESPDGWYLEMLVAEGSMKGAGLGSKMFNDAVVPYVSRYGGKNLALITNTESNCRFYGKNGFMIFSERTIEMKSRRIRNRSLGGRIGEQETLPTSLIRLRLLLPASLTR